LKTRLQTRVIILVRLLSASTLAYFPILDGIILFPTLSCFADYVCAARVLSGL